MRRYRGLGLKVTLDLDATLLGGDILPVHDGQDRHWHDHSGQQFLQGLAMLQRFLKVAHFPLVTDLYACGAKLPKLNTHLRRRVHIRHTSRENCRVPTI